MAFSRSKATSPAREKNVDGISSMLAIEGVETVVVVVRGVVVVAAIGISSCRSWMACRICRN